MAAALGYALAQPAIKLFSIFISLGFGLALPYLLLANWPGLQRWLPSPGLWMERTKQVLAFPMYAAAVWLVWVLAQQAGANAVLIALGGIVALAFAAWLYDTTRNTRPHTEKLGSFAALIIFLLTFLTGYSGINITSQDDSAENNRSTAHADRNWEPYSAERLQNSLEEGKPVFLNFTASWCISCLVNEKVALTNNNVKTAFKTAGITYLKGDWTKRDAEITKILNQFGRSGVPLYVFYPAGNKRKPVELPQVLTPDIVLNTIANTSN
jgi:thiol:disulfide interchange protein DsbD